MGMQEYDKREPLGPAEQQDRAVPNDAGDQGDHKIGELTPPSGFDRSELQKEIGTPSDNLIDSNDAFDGSEDTGDQVADQKMDSQGAEIDQENRKIGEDG